MSKKFDTEDVIAMVLSIMKTGGALNTKIAAIEAEKVAAGFGVSDGLDPIDDEAYYEQTWNEKILQRTPGIFYGIEDVQANDGGGVAAKTFTIFVEIVYLDNGQKNDVMKRIHRYTRALEEVFTEAFDAAAEMGRVKIEAVRPQGFKLELDSDEEIKVGGVSLKVSLV